MDEARALFKMKHPGIVRVIDVFEENGTAYYAMEYIEGQSLSDVVEKRGKLPEAEAVGYIRQVAEALKYVHGLNRLHLDIKPGNIMLNKDGKAVLIDFGASKHYDDETGENTSTLLGINTKGYAPVEQVNQSFKSFGPATDIYALGATLYKLLTGITPPPSNLLNSDEATLTPLPSSISSSTCQAVEAAMQLLRKNRPQSVEEWETIFVDDEKTDEETSVDNQNPCHGLKPITQSAFNHNDESSRQNQNEDDKTESSPVGIEDARKGIEGPPLLGQVLYVAFLVVVDCVSINILIKSIVTGEALKFSWGPIVLAIFGNLIFIAMLAWSSKRKFLRIESVILCVFFIILLFCRWVFIK